MNFDEKCLKSSLKETRVFPIRGKYYNLIKEFFEGKRTWDQLSLLTKGCILKMSEYNSQIIKYLKDISILKQNFIKELTEKDYDIDQFNEKVIDIISLSKAIPGDFPSMHFTDSSDAGINAINKIISGKQLMKSGNITSLVNDDQFSIDTYPLYLLFIFRDYLSSKVEIKPVYNTDGTIHMMKLNSYGIHTDRIDKINKYLLDISEKIKIKLPMLITKNSINYVPSIFVEIK